MNDVTLIIQDLTKSFGDLNVLRGINLSVQKSENIAVVGRSGQGKSVLLKCLVGMIQPDSGNIEILGEKISDLSPDNLRILRTKIGFLFQGGAIYDSMSVRENLSFVLERVLHVTDRAEIEHRSLTALENVGLKDTIDKMPSELSGGMRKRMALARTIIVNPQILLYDEPTTGLDTITSKEISRLILDIREQLGTTSIIVTHDLNCARITSDRVAVMHDGKYIAIEPYQTLSQSKDPFISSFFN